MGTSANEVLLQDGRLEIFFAVRQEQAQVEKSSTNRFIITISQDGVHGDVCIAGRMEFFIHIGIHD